MALFSLLRARVDETDFGIILKHDRLYFEALQTLTPTTRVWRTTLSLLSSLPQTDHIHLLTMGDAISLNKQMELWILHQWIGIKLDDPILLAVFRHINGDLYFEASILSQATAVPSLRTQAAQQAANEAFDRVVAAMTALRIRFSGTDRGRPFGSDAVNAIGAGAPSVLQFGANQAGAQNGACDP